jgi:hypothetical protein
MIRIRSLILVIGATVILSASGCARPIIGSKARPVALADFAAPPPAPETGSDSADDGSAAVESDDVLAAALPATGDDADDEEFIEDFLTDEFGERTVLQPTRPGERIIVDSLVGHVNGRPVYADDFLEPIEDRLLRAAEETSGVQQEQMFRVIINDWLQDVVTNELILAEAEASLTDQQQMGLFAFLGMMYDEEIRRGGGTKAGAERRRRRSGEELDQYLGRQKEMVLVDQLRLQRISPRVIVSWRDIEREYRRRYDEFNPSATLTLARIRLSNSRPELIDDVDRRLSAGEPFAVIAEELGLANGGAWETFEMGPGGVADIDVSDAMKAALEGLEEGQTSGSLVLGSSTMWLNVAEVDEPENRSIYDPDVQLGLRAAILSRRAQIEWVRYVNTLLQGGVYAELDEMAEQLFRIALVRYGT